VIVVTPNHASLYNRLKLIFGGSVNDDSIISSTCAPKRGPTRSPSRIHAAELTAALRRTQFQVRECRVFDQIWLRLRVLLRRHRTRARFSRNLETWPLVLGEIWALLHLPLGRWIWAVGERHLSADLKNHSRDRLVGTCTGTTRAPPIHVPTQIVRAIFTPGKS